MKIFYSKIIDGERDLFSVEQDVTGLTTIIEGLEYRVIKNVTIGEDKVNFGVIHDLTPAKMGLRLGELAELYEDQVS
jgi:hypothetical protein